MASDEDLFGRNLKRKKLTIIVKNNTVKKPLTPASSNLSNSNQSSNQTDSNGEQTPSDDPNPIILGPNKEGGPYQVFAIQAMIQ